MYLNIADAEAPYYDVIDLDTGQRIPLVQCANDMTGEYVVACVDKDGEFILESLGEEIVVKKN